MIRNFLVIIALTMLPVGALANDHLTNSTKDLTDILQNAVFQRFGGFSIDQIRHGEIGQARAYFVRLEKPLATLQKGVCIDFVNAGDWQVKGHPYACEQ